MNTEDNKAIAFRFFERFTASDIPGALETMAEDATWWIPGKKDRSPAAGLYPKDKIGRLFNRMVGALKSGLEMKVISCIAEGDSVALEVVSSGDLKNGREYRQEYHMLLRFRAGKGARTARSAPGVPGSAAQIVGRLRSPQARLTLHGGSDHELHPGV